MPLLGSASMLLLYDVAPHVITEHDHWHTCEHLPERLSIPGFLRGTRCVATVGGPRYLVLYEVAALSTLTSDAYMERLNNPSAWTRKLMPCFRNVTRGFCSVSGSFGFGLGSAAALLRFKPAEGKALSLRHWLIHEALPGLAGDPGLGSVHLLEAAAAAPMTNEQRIRGADAGVDWVLIFTGYEPQALERIGIGAHALMARGAVGVEHAAYRMNYTISHAEIGA